jgi:DUF4097 and DUF4098 domain-containing protein YvlB
MELSIYHRRAKMSKLIKYTMIATLVFACLAAFSSQFVKSKDFESISFLINKDLRKVDKDKYEEISKIEKFKISDVKNINLNTVSTNVEIGVSSADEIKVKIKAYVLKDPVFDFSKYVFVKDGVLNINAIEDEPSGAPIGIFKMSNHNVTYNEVISIRVLIPTGFEKTKINSVSGDILIEDVKLTDLIIDTVSGDVIFRKSAASSLKINSISGDIDLNNAELEQVKLDSVSGDTHILLNEMKQYDIDFTSVSGDFTGKQIFHKPEASQKISVNTISGDFEIGVAH